MVGEGGDGGDRCEEFCEAEFVYGVRMGKLECGRLLIVGMRRMGECSMGGCLPTRSRDAQY